MDAAEALQEKIRSAIPLADSMQFRIDSLSDLSIEVGAPLAPNVNIHGTGFAGSIYSLAVLTGWALCTHILESGGADAELVVSKAQIRYRAPVTGDLRCITRTEAAMRDAFIGSLREQGKALLELEIAVGAKPEAVLQASFHALARR